jgi:hypothetical protein
VLANLRASAAITFQTGAPRSRSTPTITPNRVIRIERDGEAPRFAVAARSHGTPAVGARRLRSTLARFRLRSRRPRKHAQAKFVGPNGVREGSRASISGLVASPPRSGGVPWRRPARFCGRDLAGQGTTDQFGEAHLFPSRFVEQALLEVSWQPERHRHAAFEQLRSGHEVMCIIVSYTMSN